jgi:hypothetical protein
MEKLPQHLRTGSLQSGIRIQHEELGIDQLSRARDKCTLPGENGSVTQNADKPIVFVGNTIASRQGVPWLKVRSTWRRSSFYTIFEV